MTQLFVYGTLKRGCKNHAQLAGQTYVGEARTTAGYRLHDLGDYPGMIADAEITEGVTGEVWSVNDAALARLDAFEGVDQGLYHRKRVTLAAPFADAAVHTYLYAGSVTGRPALGTTWVE